MEIELKEDYIDNNYSDLIQMTKEEIINEHYLYVKKIHKYNDEVIIELSEDGKNYIFSDQYIDASAICGWITERVPFKNHHYYFYKYNSSTYDSFVWYKKDINWVDFCCSHEECLDLFFNKYPKDKYIKDELYESKN